MRAVVVGTGSMGPEIAAAFATAGLDRRSPVATRDGPRRRRRSRDRSPAGGRSRPRRSRRRRSQMPTWCSRRSWRISPPHPVRGAARVPPHAGDGVASDGDIDAAVADGLAPRWVAAGPLATADLGGLATFARICDGLFPHLANDTPAPGAITGPAASGGTLQGWARAGRRDREPAGRRPRGRTRDLGPAQAARGMIRWSASFDALHRASPARAACGGPSRRIRPGGVVVAPG